MQRKWRMARIPCGADHPEGAHCLPCNEIRIAKREAASAKAMATRRLRHPHRHIAVGWHQFWASKAHAMVASAIKHGILPKLDGTIACVTCGSRAAEYEHRDYSRPLDVKPMCASCNKKLGVAKCPSREDFIFPPVGKSDSQSRAA